MTQFNPEPPVSLSEELPPIPLIPDEREYYEQQIDSKLDWLGSNDPISRLKSLEMVQADAELRYFQNRIYELEQERDWRAHRRLFQHKQEVNSLKSSPAPVNPVGREYEVQLRRQAWLDGQVSEQEDVRDQEVTFIAARYKTVIQQCRERIAQAQVQYDEAYRRWQETQQGGNFRGIA